MRSESAPPDLRPLLPEDAPALLELWQRCAAFDPVSAKLLQEKVWEDPDFCPDTALFSSDGQAFAMAVQRAQGVGYVKFLLVDPMVRRQGRGTQMLQRLEKGLKAAELRVCEGAPNYLCPGIDVRYTAGHLFFESQGYHKVGESYNLLCDLSTISLVLEERPGVRRAEARDRAVVMEFLQSHFAAWQSEVARMFENQPVSLHLAFQDDQLVGFSGYDGNNFGTGWFGPMGTHPARRGAGVGGVLLRRCLSDIKAQGHAQAIIPWVGPYRFYSNQCGARIDRVFWRYRNER